ncbi:MAG TPA: ABC transporter permease subunit/CPBP intramembrane protease [Planctomycetota bacterium]|nr:ABC transporter permease subunit/CPBP intramembrane protease [Planctomycetota bacterium]
MNVKVRAIYAKELRDMLRDRRTIFASIIIPLVLYPLLILGTAEVAQMAKAKLEREELTVAVLPDTKKIAEKIHAIALDAYDPVHGIPPPEKKEGEDAKGAEADEKLFMPKDSFKTAKVIFNEMTLEAARADLAAGKIRAILVLPVSLTEDIAAQRKVDLLLEYDQAERVSQSAASRLREMLERYSSVVVAQRLKEKALSPSFLTPFTLESKNTAAAEKVGGSILGGLLPFIFIMMLMTGAMHPAIDLTAGEKERSTLETLVGTPARPLEIITGKFLAIATISLFNAALNVGSFGGCFGALGSKTAALQFPWSALPLTLLLLVPLALFFSGLLLLVSSFASNTKEAQLYCVPVYLLPVSMMAITMQPGIELQGPLLILPVINTSLLIKELFLYHGTVQQIIFVMVSNCFYAAGMVALAARAFAREEVLFSAQGSLRLFLSRRFFKPSPTPRPGDAVLIAAIFFPLNFYLQLWLGKLVLEHPDRIDLRSLATIVVVSQYGLFFGGPLVIARYLKTEWKTTFQWNRPSMLSIIGAALMGCSAWLLTSQLAAWMSRVWPQNGGDMGLDEAFKQGSSSVGGMIMLTFLIAFSPAICEEHFFRGFFQQGLGRKNKWTTILIVGATFGVFHIYPAFRIPITGLLGVVIAYTAFQSRSIWPGVLLHFLNNGLAIFGPVLLGMPQDKPVPGMPFPDVPVKFLIPAAILFVLGLLAVKTDKKQALEKSGIP